jgi:hypothetical protein
MEKFKYSDLLNRLEGFDSWLTRLGLTPRPNDRIHQAFKVLHRAAQASREGHETGVYSDIQPGDWFAIVEALEAHDVLAAFHNDPSPTVTAALKRALSGPILPIHENPKNRDGRNIWFELALAADWRLRGASVTVEEPDLRLLKDGITFLVACKRPAAVQGVQANIRDAIKQLQRNLQNTPTSTFGVTAISLSCIFNPGDKVFSGNQNALARLLSDELGRHERFLLSVNDPKVCCIVFYVSTPSLGKEGTDLIKVSQALAWDLGRPSIGSMILRELAREMSAIPKSS